MMSPTLDGEFSKPRNLETGQGSNGAMAGARGLSPRERQIVTLLSDGCPNQQIADRLGLRLQTVKNHLSRIYRKVGVPNRVQLAVLVVNQDRGEPAV
jgi:DNA-binding CsgD family transcriptional regulator